MRKYFLILLLFISAAGLSQTAPNIIYGKDVIIQTRDTSSAELTIKNSTRNVLGYFKNIGGGKGQYTLIPQVDITALPDSLLARYTKTQADARFKSISYIPDWVDITGKPANFSTTYALSNDIQDSLLNKVSRNGSYANPSWITSLDYSKLTGTVPTWNQNTTGSAATLSAVLASNLGGAGSVSGLLKANGSGVVSAAVAGTDYVIPSALSGYLPLTAGSGQPLSGTLYSTKASLAQYFQGANPYMAFDLTSANAGYLGQGNQVVLGIPSTWIGLSSTQGVAFGSGASQTSRYEIDASGNHNFKSGTATFGGALNGTSLSMSEGGVFRTNTLIGAGSASSNYRLTLNGDATTVASGAVFRANGTDVMYFGNIVAANTTDWEMWNPRNGYIRIGVNNAEAGRFASDGTFLINTTTTDGTNKLIVNGWVKASGMITSEYAGASTGEDIGIKLNNTSGGNGIWNITSGRTGVSNDEFVIRNAVTDINALYLAPTTGAATFISSVKANGFIQGISTKTANYTLTATDYTVIFECTTSSITATLPTGVNGQIIILKKLETNAGTYGVTVATSGSDTLETFSGMTQFLGTCAYGMVTYQFLNGKWYVIDLTSYSPC